MKVRIGNKRRRTVMSLIAAVAVLVPLLVLAALPADVAIAGAGKAADPWISEPPPNPYLADSPWPASHRNSYCQASSPYPGPVKNDLSRIKLEHRALVLDVPVCLAFSEVYPDGKRVIWGSTSGFLGQKFKMDPDTFNMINVYVPQVAEGAPINSRPSPTGAYNVLDNRGNFFVPNANTCSIDAYGDKYPGVRRSPIVLRGRYTVPDEWLIRPGSEGVVGITMTYDGMIAFVTRFGTVGVVARNLSPGSARFLQLNLEAGRDPSYPDEELEQVSNSIAADEDGGIYVVTDHLMYRVQWTGSELTMEPSSGAWTCEYEAGEGQQAGRLGRGSGTTPTLMGSGDGDKFVVICDGQKLMHIVLMWRDRIPDDWGGISPDKDRRIAAELPVTFGDPKADVSYTDQSVLVRGYQAVVVNNRLKCQWLSRLGNFAMLFSGIPWIAPYGIEKFTWNRKTRRLTSAWANPDISLPNAIPTMSSATGLIYCVGQRKGVWTLEAVDWKNGRSKFHYKTTDSVFNNSFYAATEIGPDGMIYHGTLCGVSRYALR